MVPKRKKLHDALLARGYSKWFAEEVAYSDKPKLYEPPADPIKVLLITEADLEEAQVNKRSRVGGTVAVQSKTPRNRRNVSVPTEDNPDPDILDIPA